MGPTQGRYSCANLELHAWAYHYFTISKIRDPTQQMITLNPSEILTIGLFLPIGGVLADAYFGRYKVILHGMWIMWLGAMLNGLSLILSK